MLLHCRCGHYYERTGSIRYWRPCPACGERKVLVTSDVLVQIRAMMLRERRPASGMFGCDGRGPGSTIDWCLRGTR